MESLKKMGTLLTVVAALGMGGVVMTGCEQEGPAERAGERFDDALDRTGENLDRAGENVQDAADDAQDNLRDAADELSN